MASDKITRRDVVDDKVLDLGKDYARSLQPAIDKNIEWLKTFEPIKAAALEYAGIEKEFKASGGRKEFLEIKTREAKLQKETANALKAERDALLKLEAVSNKRLQNKAKEIDITNKQLTLANKEEAALKRRKTLSTQERVELQQRNKEARQLALISSSLSTAYERESARLVLLTRKYKDAAIQYGKNSNEARRYEKELKVLRDRLFQVDKAAGNFNRNVGNYPRSFGGAINSVKQLASAAGLLGGAFLAVQVARDATRTIIEFDRQLIAVRKTTNLTKEETADFSKEVVQLGLRLNGISIQGLLQSSEVAGQLGIRGSENILKFSETLEKLKLTSDIAGDEAARNFAKFIEVSSDSVENADRLGSVITELGNNFATTESQILKNTTEIQKGISIYDTTAQSVLGLGAATNALGNEAEASRGALQTAFKILNDGATAGTNLERILKLTGQTAADFRNEFANNSVETFRRFVKGLSDSEKQGENLSNTLSDLGITEKRALTVVGSLAKNYNILEDALNRANSEYESNSSLTREADQAAESLAANIADLSDSWDALVLSVENGDGSLSKAFKGVTNFFEGAIKGLILFNETFDDSIIRIKNASKDNSFNNEIGFLNSVDPKEAEEFAISQLDKTDEQIEAEKEKLKVLLEQKKALEEIETGRSRGGRENQQRGISDLNDQIENSTRSLGVLEGKLKAYDQLLGINDGAQKNLNKTIKESTDLTDEQARAEEKANRERERAYKAILRRRQLEKDAKFNLEAFNLGELIKAQKAIADNEKESFDARLQAANNQAQLELELAFLTAKNKFDIEKNFSDKEIEALLTKSKVSKDTLKKVTDEELLIIAQYQAKRKEIQGNNEGTQDNLELSRLQSEVETAKALKEKQLNDELRLENELFNQKQGIYQNEEEAVENRERRIAEIKKRYAIEALQTQIKAIETLLQAEELSVEDRTKFEAEVAEKKREISDLLVNTETDNNNKIIESEIEKTQRILSVATDLANSLNDLANSIFSARIQRIDDEITANDEKYQKLLDNELISAERKKEIQDKQEFDREQLEKKKRKEQRKQAILDKQFAALQITLNTAAAIIKFLADPGGIPGIALSISAGVIGAIQLAAALAAPIPKYALGTEDHPGGPALVGEGKKDGKYVPEVVMEPGKKPYIVDRPTVLDLPRHTKVTPTLEDYDALFRASMLSSVEIDNKKLNSFQAKVSVNNNYDVLVKEMRLTREAIKNQPKSPIHFHERKIDISHEVWAAKNRKWHQS